MTKPIDSTSVRQGRLGRQVLFILVVSLALAFVAGLVLWDALSDDAETAVFQARTLSSAELAFAAPAPAPATL